MTEKLLAANVHRLENGKARPSTGWATADGRVHLCRRKCALLLPVVFLLPLPVMVVARRLVAAVPPQSARVALPLHPVKVIFAAGGSNPTDFVQPGVYGLAIPFPLGPSVGIVWAANS